MRDVAAVFDYENLTNAVLVGADYGGVVITAAAEELLGRLSRLVYVAALIPRNGLRRVVWVEAGVATCS